jgi:predicted GNAT superfamily acetyltransferase
MEVYQTGIRADRFSWTTQSVYDRRGHTNRSHRGDASVVEKMGETNLEVRRADRLSDYEACLTIQREVWGFTDPADYASIPLLKVGNTYGGCLLVAEGSGGRILGFAYALLGREAGHDIWWSHMTAVSDEVRGTGIGFDLKVAQRDAALRSGITEVLWTFDPLRAPNAYFNIRKLGVVVSAYETSFYGISTSPLHGQMATDRLVARWDLDSDRVADRVHGNSSLVLRDFDGIVRALESHEGGPGQTRLDHGESPVLVQVPPVYPALTDGRTGARAWQEALRVTFRHYLERGYTVTDFILLRGKTPQAFYVLERQPS